MSTSKFHRNHEQHIRFSEKLSIAIKETGQDVLNQINKLDSNTSNQLICILVNRMVGDIFNVIHDLQEIVIKSNSEDKSNANLNEVIKKFCQYCNDIIQQCDSPSSTLVQQFRVFVQNIISDAEDLINIIRNDDLHDFKHELVENFKEVLYTIHITQARMQIQNYSQQELKTAVEAIQNEYFEDISKLKNCSPDVLNNVAIHIKHTVKHNFQLAYYLNKVASNYDDSEVHCKILEAANKMNIANTTFLFESENFSNTEEAIDILKNVSINCWNSFIDLLHFIDICLDNKKAAENLKDIALHIVSYGFVINKQIGKCVKNDSSFF